MGEYQSALDRIAQVEEDNGVLKTQLESCQLSLEGEKKGVGGSRKADFSVITLKCRWDPKGRKVCVTQESDVAEESPQADEVPPEQQPEATTQISQPAARDAAGVSGGCPT
ncbi:hypothetical protein PIB30_000102 [Stylosanthes scabra]|uniref:Uncharacterized protein n=1 Tax=Stylosanthes scabra TaxID=79078 RepID=A0ABU6R166_9FABA|nr:hypothetical protein [Stylosanthes scabra]